MGTLRGKAVVLLATALALAGAAAGEQPRPPETEAQPDARAARALSRMKREERRQLLLGFLPDRLPAGERPAAIGAGYVPGVPRLGIPPLTQTDAGLGVANMGGRMRRDDTATALPSGLAMGATWDLGLVERAGAMMGAEARAKGFNMLLAGEANLTREPRNGRNFQYPGEDPLLVGTLAGRSIRGIQSARIVATLKHLALNAQETGRGVLSADMGERALRESDLLAFELANEIGKPGAVMCAYNSVNGVYACENSFLLNDVLRRDWGFRGFVLSDWDAVHGVSLRAGLDQESGTGAGTPAWYGEPLSKALATGGVTASDIDRSALRILRTLYASGVVDDPVRPGGTIDVDANAVLARTIAENGIVLLKNEHGLLPVAKDATRILLVGAQADAGMLVGGGGSSQVVPSGGAARMLPIPGEPPTRRRMYASSPLAALRAALPHATVGFDDGTDPTRAAAAARGADLVLVFAEQFTTEGRDPRSLSLPGGQDALIATVAAANPRTVVVLETGGPVLMPWLDKVGAVVEAWYPGQRGGEALARVLTGKVDAAGRLPITFPASLAQTPNPALPGGDLIPDRGTIDFYAVQQQRQEPFRVTYPEGADVGYRWYERTGARPLFAFGHGLSYTSFEYRGLTLSGGRTLRAAFTVLNTGKRAGVTVAQVYARVNGVRRLVGWQGLSLAPGERRRVSVVAEPRLLASFDVAARMWRIAAGRYQVDVATAADAPKLAGSVRLPAGRLAP